MVASVYLRSYIILLTAFQHPFVDRFVKDGIKNATECSHAISSHMGQFSTVFTSYSFAEQNTESYWYIVRADEPSKTGHSPNNTPE